MTFRICERCHGRGCVYVDGRITTCPSCNGERRVVVREREPEPPHNPPKYKARRMPEPKVVR